MLAVQAKAALTLCETARHVLGVSAGGLICEQHAVHSASSGNGVWVVWEAIYLQA